jgi:hypothetical protein
MSTAPAAIDLKALQAEIAKLSPDEVAKQLLDVRTAQRVQQKKYHNADAAKAYQQKKQAKIKAMADAAKGLPATEPGFANLYEQIKKQANDAADAKLAESAAVDADESNDDVTEAA